MFREVLSGYLSPSDRLWEIAAGLIMVLTITSTIKIGLPEGEASIATMILAALGCNLAWGIADGVLYALTSGLERARYANLLSSTRIAPSMDEALETVEGQLESTIVGALDEKGRRRVAIEVVRSARESNLKHEWIAKDDIVGGFLVSILVFLSAFPAVVPLLLVDNLRIAVRLSNAVAIVMLFFVGYQNARYTGGNRLRAGVVMCLLGVVIVAACVALGG
jgi:VIT1/CCC1 family predicted Fe2+/Mn2+ transporter